MTPLNVLVVCEFSGVVRDAFRRRGHEAWSADLLLGEGEWSNYHLEGDILDADGEFIWNENHAPVPYWDLIIAHPPCTYLASSGARWFSQRQMEQWRAAHFFMTCINLPARAVAVENPVGVMSTRYRKPDQIIQPWMFGHPERKATCLWLKNLPPLQETKNVRLGSRQTKVTEGTATYNRIHHAPPSANRWKVRSLTYYGIAAAMADQWGYYLQKGRV